jgi:tRNA A37 threonylcarbamoyladenosine modification protein TsaB
MTLQVLAIDTSTEACSAALLWRDGQVLQRCVVTERGHADLILPMIDELLARRAASSRSWMAWRSVAVRAASRGCASRRA